MKKDQLLKEVSKHLANFMNAVMAGDMQIVNTTTEAMKKQFVLSIEQEAAVKIAFTHLQLLACQMQDVETLKHFVGVEINILTDVIMKKWNDLVKRLD